MISVPGFGETTLKWLSGIEDPTERALQIAAWLADNVKVREEQRNRGLWVGRFLASCGLGPGYPWCAAFVYFCRSHGGAWAAKRGEYGEAAVAGWLKEARKAKRLRATPERGFVALYISKSDPTKAHCGIVVKVERDLVYTIEGNTSSGKEGSQEDGDGVYRRSRPLSFWNRGFVAG